jgi:hypothetical protein
MAKQDLETVWIPRIGERAARELGHLRRTGFLVMAMPVVGGAAGVLIGTGTLGDIIGTALAAVAAWCLVAFIRAQRRLAAALSEWFGVKIRGLPKMNPKRFDAWAEARGLRQPDKRLVSDAKVRSSEAAPRHTR